MNTDDCDGGLLLELWACFSCRPGDFYHSGGAHQRLSGSSDTTPTRFRHRAVSIWISSLSAPHRWILQSKHFQMFEIHQRRPRPLQKKPFSYWESRSERACLFLTLSFKRSSRTAAVVVIRKPSLMPTFLIPKPCRRFSGCGNVTFITDTVGAGPRTTPSFPKRKRRIDEVLSKGPFQRLPHTHTHTHSSLAFP